MRLLLVEDNIVNQKLLSKFLEEFGSCDIAQNGQEAVDLFTKSLAENQPYDVIFMDIMMPVMDGHTALREIRKLEKQHNVPIAKETKAIMTTALSDTKNVTAAFFKGGVDAYLTKPLSREKIIQTLKEIGLIESSHDPRN